MIRMDIREKFMIWQNFNVLCVHSLNFDFLDKPFCNYIILIQTRSGSLWCRFSLINKKFFLNMIGNFIDLCDCRYRHLMLNMVSLLPHCKKDNKVESRSSKGATLNELVELKGCSSCLFFEVRTPALLST